MELGISLETISCISTKPYVSKPHKQKTKMIFAIVVAVVTLPEGEYLRLGIGQRILSVFCNVTIFFQPIHICVLSI